MANVNHHWATPHEFKGDTRASFAIKIAQGVGKGEIVINKLEPCQKSGTNLLSLFAISKFFKKKNFQYAFPEALCNILIQSTALQIESDDKYLLLPAGL